MARFQILPAETKFYDWFEKGSANLLEAARLFKDLVDNYERPSTKLVALAETEHQGDFIVREVRDLLRKTLITPLDHDETQGLVNALDDAVDIIEQAAIQMVIYQVENPTDEAHELCELILHATEEINLAMPLLRDKKSFSQIQKHVVEVNRLEREADAVYRRALEKLVATSRNDWFEFTRWKDIYEKMEDATDYCEDVANVLQAVVLKNE
jgi:predicted phosphate transport protein (TIGR00153 family)